MKPVIGIDVSKGEAKGSSGLNEANLTVNPFTFSIPMKN